VAVSKPRVDVPRLAHRPGQAAEEPVHEAALVELVLELLLVVLAAAHLAEHLDDAHQHDEVEDAQDPEEDA
jgi:hypothetical protein